MSVLTCSYRLHVEKKCNQSVARQMSVLTCSYRLHVEKKWNQSVASQIVLRDIIRKIFPIDVLRYMIWQCLWLMYCANWSGRLSERPQWMDCTIWETVCNWDSSLLTCSTKWCEKLCSVHVLHLLVYNVVLAAKVSCWSTSFLSHFFFFFSTLGCVLLKQDWNVEFEGLSESCYYKTPFSWLTFKLMSV